MPQFSPQSKRPVSPKTYAAAARMLRRSADALESRAASSSVPPTAQDKRALTRIINGLLYAVRVLRDKHTSRSSS